MISVPDAYFFHIERRTADDNLFCRRNHLGHVMFLRGASAFSPFSAAHSVDTATFDGRTADACALAGQDSDPDRSSQDRNPDPRYLSVRVRLSGGIAQSHGPKLPNELCRGGSGATAPRSWRRAAGTPKMPNELSHGAGGAPEGPGTQRAAGTPKLRNELPARNTDALAERIRRSGGRLVCRLRSENTKRTRHGVRFARPTARRATASPCVPRGVRPRATIILQPTAGACVVGRAESA